MLLDIVIAGSCGGAGICCGWVMHGLHRAGGPVSSYRPGAGANERSRPETNAIAGPKAAVAAEEPVNVANPVFAEKVASVAERIRSFVAIIAENVDEHQTRVDAVSGVLHARDLSRAAPEIVEAVEQLLAANETMRKRLDESQERMREQAKQLQSAEQLAETDALTQIANRRAFDNRLDRQHGKGAAEAGVMAILDIDFFKQFNDEHGHRVGDEVLRSVAQMLEARLQPYGLVARFGGEEFCVMIHSTSYAEAIEIIEKTRAAISNREIRFEGKQLRVTLSVGIGTLRPQESTDEWLQRVDDALYRSKEVGRNCAHYIEGDRFIRAGANPINNVKKLNSPACNRVEAARPIDVAPDEPSVVQIKAMTAEIRSQVRDFIGSETDEGLQLDRIAASLSAVEPTERPKALAYLPDRETMMDGILESIAASRNGQTLPRLMAVTLSGQPGGATMRSVLQLVRAATRSQDRIGCLDHSTLLVCLPDCDSSEAKRRAEQICTAAASIGVSLAAPGKSQTRERLSIGIIAMDATQNTDSASGASRSVDVDLSGIRHVIAQTQAAALLAARLTSDAQAKSLPIWMRHVELADSRNGISSEI